MELPASRLNSRSLRTTSGATEKPKGSSSCGAADAAAAPGRFFTGVASGRASGLRLALGCAFLGGDARWWRSEKVLAALPAGLSPPGGAAADVRRLSSSAPATLPASVADSGDSSCALKRGCVSLYAGGGS